VGCIAGRVDGNLPRRVQADHCAPCPLEPAFPLPSLMHRFAAARVPCVFFRAEALHFTVQLSKGVGRAASCLCPWVHPFTPPKKQSFLYRPCALVVPWGACLWARLWFATTRPGACAGMAGALARDCKVARCETGIGALPLFIYHSSMCGCCRPFPACLLHACCTRLPLMCFRPPSTPCQATLSLWPLRAPCGILEFGGKSRSPILMGSGGFHYDACLLVFWF
jgi:hypothetical protein